MYSIDHKPSPMADADLPREEQDRLRMVKEEQPALKYLLIASFKCYHTAVSSISRLAKTIMAV